MQMIILAPILAKLDADDEKALAEIAAKVAAYHKSLAEFEIESRQLTAAGAGGNLTPAQVASLSNRPGRKLQLLREELELRTLIDNQWRGLWRKAWSRAHNEMSKRCEETEAALRADLLKLG